MDLETTVVFDAKGLVLGRMASIVAKHLLLGERIIIVNAEKAIVSGKRSSKMKEAKSFLEVGHPRKGPIHYRRPDRIVRRTIYGMLPHRKPVGRQAYKRLRVFLGVPQKYEGKEMKTIEDANVGKLRCPYVTVGEVAKEIGWIPTGE